MMPSSHVRSSVFVIEALKTDANDMKDESIKKELWDNFYQSLMRITLLRGKGKKLFDQLSIQLNSTQLSEE